MSAPSEPLRLLLLAADASWAAQLDACLAQLGQGVSVISAPSWAAASSLFEDSRNALLLSTPACLPAAQDSHLPIILLLDAEPAEAPPGGCDWLVRGQLTPDALRRCLRYARERQQLQEALQLLAEQDALTGIETEATRRDALGAATVDSQTALDRALRERRAGTLDYLDLLIAQRSLFAAQDSFAQSNAAQAVNLIALAKALGGGWQTVFEQGQSDATPEAQPSTASPSQKSPPVR